MHKEYSERIELILNIVYVLAFTRTQLDEFKFVQVEYFTISNTLHYSDPSNN